MHEGIYIAASGAFKQEQKLDIIANNLANMGNSGFKRDALAFQEMIPPFTPTANLVNAVDPQYTGFPADLTVSYVGINHFFTDPTQGSLRPTGNPLDLGLDGEGYLVVETPEGQRYTRGGNLKLSPKGNLATQEGYNVLGQDGKPIQVDGEGGQINIDATGAISVGNGLQNTPVGNLKLVAFDDPASLTKEGNGLFRLSDPGAKEQTPKDLNVRQGLLESSNVNPVKEMTEMITTMRAFEAYQKIIQSIDEADDQAVNAIGRLG